MTATYTIALIPGDGIGTEVVAAAWPVLLAAAKLHGSSLLPVHHPWGCRYYLDRGAMMPADGLDQLAGVDAILLGAVGFPELVPDDVSLHGLLLPIRQQFQQYVNLRPHRLLAGVSGPLREDKLDVLCIRENSEGEYVGAGGRAHRGSLDEVVVETSIFTRRGCERVVRFAFEQALQRSSRLAAATKSNAQRHTMVFWDEVCALVAADYPQVQMTKYHIDALCARFVTDPGSLDVVVASNLFGDILTDLGAALQGGLGFAASGNLDPTRRYPSMFEPVHGSTPDIAGTGTANPAATIWAGALMLDWLGEHAASQSVMQALEAVTLDGSVGTPDLGGTASTSDFATAVQANLQGGARV